MRTEQIRARFRAYKTGSITFEILGRLFKSSHTIQSQYFLKVIIHVIINDQ